MEILKDGFCIMRATTLCGLWSRRLIWFKKNGSRILDDCWEEVFNNEGKSGFANYYYKIQMRKASSNGRFLLLSTGFDPGLFEVDMDMKTVTEIQMSSNESQVGRIYSLSEEWPPKVYFKG